MRAIIQRGWIYICWGSLRSPQPTYSTADEFQEFFLIQHGDAQVPGLVRLGAGFFADDHIIGFLRHAANDLGAESIQLAPGFIAGHGSKTAGEDEGFAGERGILLCARGFGPVDAGFEQVADDFTVVSFAEESVDVLGHGGTDAVYLLERFAVRIHDAIERSEMIRE